MTQEESDQLRSSPLRKYFKGNNFITPEIIEYKKTPKGTVYELSTGRGIFTPNLWGVTISEEMNPTQAESSCFTTFKEAQDFINQL